MVSQSFSKENTFAGILRFRRLSLSSVCGDEPRRAGWDGDGYGARAEAGAAACSVAPGGERLHAVPLGVRVARVDGWGRPIRYSTVLVR